MVMLYQDRISSRCPRRCAYPETCSEYALRQLTEQGFLRGGLAAVRRYRSCTAATAERFARSAMR
jgi:putative component of membrane protein insertase Oxa1/YidC/SpoIIIJ protein YidD